MYWASGLCSSYRVVDDHLKTKIVAQTPLFDSMFEEFACKHMLHKLEQGDSAALSALERQEDGGEGRKDREAEGGVATAVVATSV